MAKFANGDKILKMNLCALAADIALLANLLGIKQAKKSLQVIMDKMDLLEIEEPKGTEEN
mgnify:CR=1 FL=1